MDMSVVSLRHRQYDRGALWVGAWGLGPYFFGDFVGRWFGALRQKCEDGFQR